jgi:hypothetical protein
MGIRTHGAYRIIAPLTHYTSSLYDSGDADRLETRGACRTQSDLR